MKKWDGRIAGIYGVSVQRLEMQSDAIFIASARTDIPNLYNAVIALANEVEWLQKFERVPLPYKTEQIPEEYNAAFEWNGETETDDLDSYIEILRFGGISE